MRGTVLVILGVLACVTARHLRAEDEALPPGLLIGAGVSACQAEGAWNLSGKAESVLDKVAHSNKVFPANVDVAADHYHRYKEDLAYAKEMHFNSHRFSISWSRVLPTGDANNPSMEGVSFYHEYIKEIKAAGMEPMVTMSHFDHPFTLEESSKGWTNAAMISKFEEYANFLFKTYGSEVKYWTTINEPNMFCNYFTTILFKAGLAPNADNDIYRCLHHITLAHLRVYRLYKDLYYKTQQGLVGCSAMLWPTVPATTNSEDMEAAEAFIEMYTGTVLHPLIYGEYPPVTRYLVDKRSKELGLPESRLPHFTQEEKAQLEEQPTDFIALNVYSGFKASYKLNDSDGDAKPKMLGPISYDMPFLKLTGVSDFGGDVDRLTHDAILRVWDSYHKPIVIAENGFGDTLGLGINDDLRAAYHSASLRSLIRSMNEYGINVLGYYVWALLDVFEFSAGYSGRPFGLVHVDYESGSLKRTLKESSKFFIKLGETGKVPYVAPPEQSTEPAPSTALPSTPTALPSTPTAPSSTPTAQSTATSLPSTTTQPPSTSASTRGPTTSEKPPSTTPSSSSCASVSSLVLTILASSSVLRR
ncbi:hypothetical protein ONE63_000067 [Megalurothrips usitatus]|uniref:Myrosinase 1-like n=1 Tax=Megalurothrips usitatus TaxID=439358 RepID=A0AAV7XXB8_9NEOP|nr:hypothetical protein ONE63_000067 [Megalurothrips usitatus]